MGSLSNYILIQNLSNKFICRSWLQTYVNVLPFKLLSLNESIDEKILVKEWPTANRYVLQYTISNGGEGTYIYTLNDLATMESIPYNYLFMVSPFLENSLTVSCQIIVYENDILVFPLNLSNSYISNEKNCRPVYKGSDFASAYKIPRDDYRKTQQAAKQIGCAISQLGYRGICGIDFIIQDHNVFLIEVNPRYLGSSFLIDIALLNNDLPVLAFFNEESFMCKAPNHEYKEMINNLSIPLKSHVFSYNEYFSQKDLDYFLSQIPYSYSLFLDGLDDSIPLKEYERDTYLFRTVEHIQ